MRARRLTLCLAAVLVVLSSTVPARGQITDRSGQGGTLSGRIDAAVREAGAAGPGAAFMVAFRFRGLVPSDAGAGSAGSLVIQRYGGWTITGAGGLLQTTDPWNALGSGEQLLDLASMSMVAPPPEPTLVERPLLAFLRGTVSPGGRPDLQDVQILMPEGTLRVRDRAVYWLGQVPADEVLGWSRAQLDLPADRTPVRLARSLAGLVSVLPQAAAPVDLLRSLAVGHEDSAVRQLAITYLGRRPEDTVRILDGILESAREVEERSQALESLADRLGPAAKDRLVRAARDRDEDPGLRRGAVAYLSRVPGSDVDGTLEGLLSDPDERLRQQVVEAWERREPRRAVPLLERAARDDSSRRVRMQCVASLGDIEGEGATQALERLFGIEGDEEMRVEALQELTPRRTEGRVDWLTGLALNDASMEVRKEAVRQLARLGDDPAARRALQRIIDVGRP